jgi:hypothetical protein
MREGIAKHHGYEIITEGDSFQVAFATCQAALAFCVDIQYRFLEQTWSKEVLRLNACKVVRGEYDAYLRICVYLRGRASAVVLGDGTVRCATRMQALHVLLFCCTCRP